MNQGTEQLVAAQKDLETTKEKVAVKAQALEEHKKELHIKRQKLLDLEVLR